MATKTNSMFRISQLAKDFGLKPKDLVTKLEGIGISVKSTSATLDEGDVNALFASMTDGARIQDLDGYLHGKTSITLPESPEDKAKREEAEKAEAARVKAEAEAKQKAEEEAKKRAEEEAKKNADIHNKDVNGIDAFGQYQKDMGKYNQNPDSSDNNDNDDTVGH